MRRYVGPVLGQRHAGVLLVHREDRFLRPRRWATGREMIVTGGQRNDGAMLTNVLDHGAKADVIGVPTGELFRDGVPPKA